MLHIIEPGWSTRVVDFGRPGTRSLGVPVGGAADRSSLMLGNALVGNSPGVAALEISVKGPRIQAECDLACVVFGAPFELALIGRNRVIRAGVTFTLAQGEELVIGGTPDGLRAYLCVGGGLQVPEILGSGSSLDALVGETALACLAGSIGGRYLPAEVGREWEAAGPLRVVAGLQASWFSEGEFFGQEFTVSSASNRMGLRLEGRPLRYPAREMVSEPVCPGAVQVTRDGQCIVLGVDGQTIGGYPKIAQVIAADLDRLGQLRPGQRLRFIQIGLEEALAIYREKQVRLAEWIFRLQVSLDAASATSKLK